MRTETEIDLTGVHHQLGRPDDDVEEMATNGFAVMYHQVQIDRLVRGRDPQRTIAVKVHLVEDSISAGIYMLGFD